MKAAEITKEEKYVAPEVEFISLSLESGVLSGMTDPVHECETETNQCWTVDDN